MKRRESVKFLEFDGEITEKGGYRVILIQEGLGNLSDCYYYSKESLKFAFDNNVFEGKKIFADHPSITEDMDRPERSVKDAIGHFESVKYEETEDGKGYLSGVVRVPAGLPYEWVRSTFAHAIEYSKKYNEKDYVGLSINASGDAEAIPMRDLLKIAPIPCHGKIEKALELGIETAKLTRKITEAVSCDLVTEAGAGGKILNLIEKDKQMDPKNHPDMEQDIELIKSMIAKYMGEEEVDEKEYSETAEAYKEMGLEAEEAYQAAAKHMKAAAILAKKGETAEADKKDEVPTEDRMKDAEEADKKEKCESEESEEKKEEEETKVKESQVSLVARVAFLENELKKRDLNDHIESTLAKSGLSRQTTKLFKECLGNVKSVKEFDKMFETFKEGFKAAKDGEVLSFISNEKVVVNDKESESFDFSKCLE